MTIARFIAAPDGSMAALVTPAPGEAHGRPPGSNELDFDTDTNPTVAAAIDTDSRAFALTGGVLRRNGTVVSINPPGPVEQERLTGANVVAVLDQLQAYRDAANPTAANTIGIVKLLCRIAQVLIRRLA